MTSCIESVGDKIDEAISGVFLKIGTIVANRPKTTLFCTILLAIICAGGITTLETENRADELWVPQDTISETEETMYLSYFPRNARFNTIIVTPSSSNNKNVLDKEILIQAMELHQAIETNQALVEGETYTLTDLCVRAGGSCSDFTATDPICTCLVSSILRQWDYSLEKLQNDNDFLATLNEYGSKQDLQGVLGNAVFDNDTGALVSAEAFSMSYFLANRAIEEGGDITDPINSGWEEAVFLKALQEPSTDMSMIEVDFFSARSFEDEFGGAITGDLVFVQVSYVVAFIFLGATLGAVKCGPGSRWSMSLAALVLVALSTMAGFGISSLFGLFFGPVHSLLPFILLGIGVDDAFVIVNAFNRERTAPRKDEPEESLIARSARALSRAGASITVTSLTDLVAFAISSSSALPALASFCAYASICIFFLWFLASTFFTAAMVIDEKRQRDRGWDILCCFKRKPNDNEDEQEGFQEGISSTYFRKYHAPAILSLPGKAIVLLLFSGLLGYGFYGALNLSVEDSERNFIPAGSYINDYLAATDQYFASSSGVSLFVTFENMDQDIYDHRDELATLNQRLTGKSTAPPYIAEPVSEDAYQNVMTGFYDYLSTAGTAGIGNVTLGEDNWPTTYQDFVTTITMYANVTGPGARYAQDVSVTQSGSLEAIRVHLEYVTLTKIQRGELIDDADRQIEAMDETRSMIHTWNQSGDLPQSFPYSEKFLTIEGFKIIRRELFQNVGLAILAVGIIVLCTVASPATAILITLNVGFCIIEILGFMYAFGIVIDSVSVINIVLAVGLSVDYSAHIGHCFMVKGGDDKNVRATEALADIGASVLNGATSTFLAVAILLGSSSYVFQTLSTQFALTVILGVSHGLILLPVMLSILGPKPFSSAEPVSEGDKDTGDNDAAVEANRTNDETDKNSA